MITAFVLAWVRSFRWIENSGDETSRIGREAIFPALRRVMINLAVGSFEVVGIDVIRLRRIDEVVFTIWAGMAEAIVSDAHGNERLGGRVLRLRLGGK